MVSGFIFTVPQMIALGAVCVVLVVICGVVSKKKIREKAKTGEDKKIIWDILQNCIPEIENYTKAYACWRWETQHANRSTITYWYYAIAFHEERICIVPFVRTGKKKEISCSQYFIVDKGDVGIVNSKKGANWAELYDKEQNEIVSLMVFGENLENNSYYHPVNIIQPEAEAAFIKWKDRWMDEVNGANGVAVTGKMKRPVKKK